MRTPRYFRLLITSLVLFCVHGAASAAPDPLACDDDKNDAAALKTAPHCATRVNPHVLTVNYQGGVKRFEDQPPYQEAFGGAHWYYCGYVPALRAHLVGKNENALFSGVLLLDDTGQMVDAGQSIYPSPDGKSFLAIRQEQGKEDSLWLVAERSGKTLWDGYAALFRMAIEKPGGKPVEQVDTWYKDPFWTEGGVLQATAVCNPPGTLGVANLVSDGGTWRWQTNVQCTPPRGR